MALSAHRQALELVKRSTRPVIVLPHACGADGYATAFALAHVLRSMELTVDIVAADGPMPKTLEFLKGDKAVKPVFGQLRRLVVSLDTRKAPLDELSYDIHGGILSVYLTPRSGEWSTESVEVSSGAYRYDLIIAIGATNLESLGELFAKQTQFFFETPLINIDHVPENEQFGQINIVDLTATSSGEVMMQVLEKWDHALLTEDVATMLLTGMIAKTESFKSAVVTPKTLKHASMLIERGADRQTIVDHLYRTRSVQTLRLWGRALARLKADESVSLVWTVLSQQDFLHAGAGEEELPDVIEELIRNSPAAKTVVVLFENEQREIHGLISGGPNIDSLELALPLKPAGTRDLAQIYLPKEKLGGAEGYVMPIVKKRLLDLRG